MPPPPPDASTLTLRSVASLLCERFFVPSYQRGYRWTDREVRALLDDLRAFRASAPGPDAWYCLQPVVVAPRPDGAFEVVDGQQRLTTLHLLLTALQDLGDLLGRGRYTLEYATREGSAAFLDTPTQEGADSSIDHHHIWQAYATIRSWLDDLEGGARLDLYRCVTDPDGQGPNVRAIWYALAPQDPVPVFVRLNVGRIPLTSAELIRAGLLGRDSGRKLERRLQLAGEWDRAERRLRDPAFWYFVQDAGEPPLARVEVLFELLVRARPEPPRADPATDPLATWLNLEALDLDDPWAAARAVLDRLEDWYEDTELFHLVGFLVATAPAARGATAELVQLLADREGRTASEFTRRLRWRAWRRVRGERAPAVDTPRPVIPPEKLDAGVATLVGELTYGQPTRLRATLLLFNIAGLLEKGGREHRLAFDRFKRERWDLEHVRSVAEYQPRSPAARRRWLERARSFLDSPAARLRDPDAATRLAEEVDASLAQPAPDAEAFAALFTGIRELSGEAEARAGDDALSNLCLLDTATNRGYQNAIFPVKRRWVLDRERQGRFVLPATRDLFLKVHHPEATQFWVWDASDQDAYETSLRRTLRALFAPLAEAP